MRKIKGITLVEIMVTIFILGIISVPIYFLLEDSTKKGNIAVARDNIKQEANKVFAVLENDITQARKPDEDDRAKGVKSLSFTADTVSMQVRRPEAEEEEKKFSKMFTGVKQNNELKYRFNKPQLHRFLGNKCWLVSKNVEEFDISPSIDGSAGKYVVSLTMKANMIGLKADEQPTYHQEKIIVCMEEATEKNDPFWREVGDLNKFFVTEGNILAGLKEDASQLIENFAQTFGDALGDIKNMTIGELKNVVTDLKKNLLDVKTNIADINKDIKDLDWEAMYERNGVLGEIGGFFTGNTNKKKREAANKVKEKIAGLKSLDDFAKNSFESIKSSAKKGMDETAIKAMYDSKKQLYEARAQIVENLDKVKAETDEDLGIGDLTDLLTDL